VTRIQADLLKENCRNYSDNYSRSLNLEESKDDFYNVSASKARGHHSNILFGFSILNLRDLKSKYEASCLDIKEEEEALSNKLELRRKANRENINR
jgi:hypothetical protein